MSSYSTAQAITCHALKNASGSTTRVYEYLRNIQALAEHHGRGWITPRAQTIAEAIGRHTRTVRRALAELRARGLVVCQARYVKKRSGIVRQISNRMRVILNIASAALAAQEKTKTTKGLSPYRADKLGTPNTEPRLRTVQKVWTTSPLYRSIMADGLKKGSRIRD